MGTDFEIVFKLVKQSDDSQPGLQDLVRECAEIRHENEEIQELRRVILDAQPEQYQYFTRV